MEGERRSQPSWAGSESSIRITRSRFGDLNALFAIGAVIAAYLLTFYLPIIIGPNEGRVVCNVSAQSPFCFDDPIPDVDVGTASLWAFLVVGVIMIAGSYVLRRGFLVIAPAEIVIMVIMTVTTLSRLSHYEHRQALLRSCHYGTSGQCPGIENLAPTSP